MEGLELDLKRHAMKFHILQQNIISNPGKSAVHLNETATSGFNRLESEFQMCSEDSKAFKENTACGKVRPGRYERRSHVSVMENIFKGV